MKFQKRLFEKKIRNFLVRGYRNINGPTMGFEKVPSLVGWDARVVWLGPIRLLVQKQSA